MENAILIPLGAIAGSQFRGNTKMADYQTRTGLSSVSLKIEEALKEYGIDEVLDVTVSKLLVVIYSFL